MSEYTPQPNKGDSAEAACLKIAWEEVIDYLPAEGDRKTLQWARWYISKSMPTIVDLLNSRD